MRRTIKANSANGGRINPDFELTGYERQVLANVANPTSPVRDPDCAAWVSCFFAEYVKTRLLPQGDIIESFSQVLGSGSGGAKLPPEELLLKEKRRERNRLRRRAVVDDVLRRSGYVPTRDELDEQEKQAAKFDEEAKQFRDECRHNRERMKK